MFDIARKLAVLPYTPRETLSLLEDLVEVWRGRTGIQDGCTHEELVAAQERLGMQIPSPLRGFLTLYGRSENLMGFQEPLLKAHDLHVEDDVLVIQEENQGCALWGVAAQQLSLRDPPTLFKIPADAGYEWRPYHDRLSVHILEAILNEFMASSDNRIFREFDEGSAEVLASSLLPVGIPEHPFWAEPDGPAVKWLAGAEFLVRLDGDAVIWASAPLGCEMRDILSLVPDGWERADS
ncbi:hypothetical protein [Frankia sp. R43]|uniref:hypothetical protein n=1 Tax=Frankia sp. R43 TaxID=269536 RepID=UPI000A4C3A78|nr:hypothetical protein [Frankia sp. R43]